MAIRTELTFQLQNTPGALSSLCGLLDTERINILAVMLEAGGVIRMVVDNPVHAAGLLRERGYRIEEREALFVSVPNNPGASAAVARMLASAGVNVEYFYATVLEGHPMATVVVGVADPQRASSAAGL